MLSCVPTATATGDVGVHVMYEPEPLKVPFSVVSRPVDPEGMYRRMDLIVPARVTFVL